MPHCSYFAPGRLALLHFKCAHAVQGACASPQEELVGIPNLLFLTCCNCLQQAVVEQQPKRQQDKAAEKAAKQAAAAAKAKAKADAEAAAAAAAQSNGDAR